MCAIKFVQKPLRENFCNLLGEVAKSYV